MCCRYSTHHYSVRDVQERAPAQSIIYLIVRFFVAQWGPSTVSSVLRNHRHLLLMKFQPSVLKQLNKLIIKPDEQKLLAVSHLDAVLVATTENTENDRK